ncbi:thioredoxin family protein [Niabella aquatica]
MKHVFSILLTTILLNYCYAQQFEVTKDRTGKKMLKGFVTDSVMKADTTAFAWYADNERVYEPSADIVRSFSGQKDSVAFLIFFGTWCPDSHYVVPRFYKIVEQAGLDKSRVTLFALDRTKNDAAHLAANFNILHVPTIIVLKNGKEQGRVIEYGATGKFDEELAGILKRTN